MDINLLVSQLQSAVVLYAEILACIVAAGLLGWLVGLMMQRSRHERQLSQSDAHWEERYDDLEKSARSDTENLEEQLQSLAKETKSLQATNRALTESLKKNDTNTQKSRAEAIELNRQHTETHERLQRIIQHKDREIAELGNRLSMDSHATRKASTAHRSTNTTLTANSTTTDIAESDLNNADTIAIAPGQLPHEAMDATVQMSVSSSAHRFPDKKWTRALTVDADELLDDTSRLNDFVLEESTVAMDDEALAFAQRSSKGRGD